MRVTPIEACSPVKIIELLLKIEHLVMCLATMAYAYPACPVCVTIFSTGSKFRPVSELHALTLAARSYVLLAAI